MIIQFEKIRNEVVNRFNIAVIHDYFNIHFALCLPAFVIVLFIASSDTPSVLLYLTITVLLFM